jgi:hypothetical protein
LAETAKLAVSTITEKLSLMKFILSLLLALSFISGSGQSNVAIYSNNLVSGKNYITGSDIISAEFVFPEKIFHSYIDTLNNGLTIELRGTGKNGKWLTNNGQVLIYDLTSRKEKWFRKLNYIKNSLEQTGDNVFLTAANKSVKLNFENGAEEWSMRNNIYLTNPKYNIVAGYRIPGTSNSLEAYSLSGGNVLWKRDINREFGWNEIHHVNDSVIVISASGIHTVDLRNGSGWDYHTATGRNDYTGMVLTNVAGVALGLLTGTFMYSTAHDVLTGIASNLLIDSSDIYLASREKVVSYNHNGQCNWYNLLPKDMLSSSSIFADDSLIYLINRGYAYFNGRQVDYGTPFFAAFDKQSGKQIFMQETGKKKEQVMDYEVRNDELLLIFRDRLAKYNMKDGSPGLEKSYSGDTSGIFVSLAGSQVFYKSDSGYSPVTAIDTTRYILVTNKNKIIMFNNDLEPESFFNDDDLYVLFAQKGQFRFLNREDITRVINIKGEEVAELSATSNALIIGTKLYEVRDKSYIETDLSELFSDTMP